MDTVTDTDTDTDTEPHKTIQLSRYIQDFILFIWKLLN
jgi:hypothetical protein